MERRLLSGILVIMFSAIMMLCGALSSQEAFADATPEQKTKLDKLVEKFNKDPIIRVPGLNKLRQDASEEELNKIYDAAIEEVKKKTRAEKFHVAKKDVLKRPIMTGVGIRLPAYIKAYLNLNMKMALTARKVKTF